jgi:hypothetical protein
MIWTTLLGLALESGCARVFGRSSRAPGDQPVQVCLEDPDAITRPDGWKLASVDPVADGLRIQLEPFGELVHSEEGIPHVK